MVTFVPGGRSVFFSPRRSNVLGVPASNAQFSVVPSGFLTSTYSQECGLIHSTFVILPVTWTGLFTSNSAVKEWCASTDGPPSTRKPPANTNETRLRTPPLYLCRTPILQHLAYTSGAAAGSRASRTLGGGREGCDFSGRG